MSCPDYGDIPDFDCQDSMVDTFAAAHHAGMEAARAHTVLMSAGLGHDLLPDEVHRRRLRGSQLTKLRAYVLAAADPQTVKGLAVLKDLEPGTEFRVTEGRWYSDSEWEFDLTAPALRWLRSRRGAVERLFPNARGESLRLLNRLFE